MSFNDQTSASEKAFTNNQGYRKNSVAYNTLHVIPMEALQNLHLRRRHHISESFQRRLRPSLHRLTRLPHDGILIDPSLRLLLLRRLRTILGYIGTRVFLSQ
jgi:hypothetical protein